LNFPVGQLPMDRNLMECCEAGVGFIDEYPDSVACKPLSDIVAKIISQVQ